MVLNCKVNSAKSGKNALKKPKITVFCQLKKLAF